MTTKGKCAGESPAGSLEGSKRGNHGRIVVAPDEGRCLDTVQLNQLEQSFRDWVEESSRKDVRLSRRRVLLLFLIIRYTGAKLKEVLALDPSEDIDLENRAIFFRGADRSGQRPPPGSPHFGTTGP
jgi:molybdate transport system regulatory protein